jgi:hypothetical protein
MGLQFNLWGVFRQWGENTEAEWSEEPDDQGDDKTKLRKAINLGKLYGSLVVDGIVSLQILKVAVLADITDGRSSDLSTYSPSRKRSWKFSSHS